MCFTDIIVANIFNIYLNEKDETLKLYFLLLVYLSLKSKPTLAYLETNYVEVYEKSEKQSPSNRTVDIPGLQTASERRTTSPANRTEDTRGSTLETNYVYS